MPAKRTNPRAVFLNLPYDREFEPLYLAYIAGMSSLRLIPRVTLGISGGERRLDRISAAVAVWGGSSLANIGGSDESLTPSGEVVRFLKRR